MRHGAPVDDNGTKGNATMTDSDTIAQARALLEAVDTLPADLLEHDVPRSSLLEHERILWQDNPDANPDDVAEALRCWRVEQATKRKADAERRAAEVEAARLRRLCSYPGCQLDGIPRVLCDVPAEHRLPLRGSAGTASATPIRLASSYAIGRRTYESDPGRPGRLRRTP